MKSQNKTPMHGKMQRHKGQNSVKTIKRLMKIVLKNYTPHCIVVLLSI